MGRAPLRGCTRGADFSSRMTGSGSGWPLYELLSKEKAKHPPEVFNADAEERPSSQKPPGQVEVK
jgi:hypothetical protein